MNKLHIYLLINYITAFNRKVSFSSRAQRSSNKRLAKKQKIENRIQELKQSLIKSNLSELKQSNKIVKDKPIAITEEKFCDFKTCQSVVENEQQKLSLNFKDSEWHLEFLIAQIDKQLKNLTNEIYLSAKLKSEYNDCNLEEKIHNDKNFEIKNDNTNIFVENKRTHGTIKSINNNCVHKISNINSDNYEMKNFEEIYEYPFDTNLDYNEKKVNKCFPKININFKKFNQSNIMKTFRSKISDFKNFFSHETNREEILDSTISANEEFIFKGGF